MNLIEQLGLIVLIIMVILILITVFVALMMVVRILKSVRKISTKAQQTTDNLADIAMMIGKRVAPVALSAAVAAALRRLKRK